MTRFVVCPTIFRGSPYPSVILCVSKHSIVNTLEGYLKQKFLLATLLSKKDTCFHSFSYAHKNCLLKVIDKHKSGWGFKWFVIKIARINGICIRHASWITFSNGLRGGKKSFCCVIESSQSIILKLL